MKILILSLKGLGDTLMQVPFIRAVRAGDPAAEITILVPDPACASVFENCRYVKPVEVGFRRPGPSLLPETLRLLWSLRASKFDAVATTFPSNRVWYNLLARWTGAPLRITHSYAFGSLRTLAFLQNRRIPADPALHEVEHNLRLLGPLGLRAPEKPDLSPWLSAEDEAFAERFFSDRGLPGGRPVAALHPAINPRQIYKAWAPENAGVFAGLADWLAAAYGARVLLFCGPDEKASAAEVMAGANVKPELCSGLTVNQAAALLKRCDIFINTDSGLGHLAAAAGVPAITVFGPANPAMTAPYGSRNQVVLGAPDCRTCYRYPYSSTTLKLGCEAAACLKTIDMDRIKEAAARVLGPAPSRA